MRKPLLQTLGAFALAACLPLAARATVNIVSQAGVYYDNGALAATGEGDAPVVDPFGIYTVSSATTLRFSAIPPAGRKLDRWLLLSQAAATKPTEAEAAQNAFRRYPENAARPAAYTVAVEGIVGDGLTYYICPCFSWLTYELRYVSKDTDTGMTASMPGLVYTNDVTLATAEALTNATGRAEWLRAGYSLSGWATTEAGEAAFPSGAALATAGERLGATTNGLVTLYAVWAKKTATIRLDARGGTVSSATVSVQVGDEYALPTPTAEGRRFEGWYTAATGGTRIANGSVATGEQVEGLTVLYARWSDVTFELYYRGNYSGHDARERDASYAYTNTVTLATPTKEWTRTGWDFKGWALTANAATAAWRAGASVTMAGRAFEVTADGQMVTLYAVWAKRQMAIALDARGGTVSPASVTVQVDGTYSLPTPTRTGFVFNGWFTAATGGEQVVTGTKVVRDDIATLYAQWTPITYTLAYRGNYAGNDTEVDAATYAYGASVTVKSLTKEWTRTGWDFKGWALTANGAARFQAGQVLANAGGAFGVAANGAKVVLYAVWAKRPMTIALDARGGTVSPSSITVEIEGTYALPTPTKAHHWFRGWWTAAAGGVQIANGATVTRDDIAELYARWEEKPQHEVTFVYRDADGGEVVRTQNVYEEEDAVPPDDEAVDGWVGHTFTGWDADYTAVAGALTVTAQYEANAYWIYFDPNGGQGRMERQRFTYGEAAALADNAYTRGRTEAWRFGGWATNETGAAVYADGEVVSNLTAEADAEMALYAVWEDALTDLSRIADSDIVLEAEGGAWRVDDADFVAGDGAVVVSNQTALGATVTTSIKGTVYGSGTIVFQWKANRLNGGQGQRVWKTELYRDGTLVAVEPGTNGWGAVSLEIEAQTANVSTPLEWRITAMTGATQSYIVWLDDIQWIPDGQYTVAFDANGGDGGEPMTPVDFFLDEWETLPRNAFTRTGHTFAGWAEVPEGEAVYADHETVSNVCNAAAGETNTLYAVWTVNQYAVAFEANGGAGGETNCLDYGATIVAPTVTREGYTFAGWTPDVAATMPAHDVAYTAQWVINQYTVIFDANGGAGSVTNRLDYGAAIVAPADPVREGYTFTGWTPDVAEALPAHDVTYTAQWTKKEQEKPSDPDPGSGDDPDSGSDAGGDSGSGSDGGSGSGTDSGSGSEQKPDPSPNSPSETDEPLELSPSGEAATGAFTAESAAVYTGWLRDADGRIAALLTVKTGAVKKSGAVSKVTMTITPLAGKKRTVKTTVVPGGNPTNEYGVVFGNLRLSGTLDGLTVEAAKDFSKAKVAPEKAKVNEMPKGTWAAVFDTGAGQALFSVAVAAKGKAKVTGFLPNGTKVTATAQGVLGEERFAVPVVNAKKGVGFVLWIDGDGAAEVSDIYAPAWSVVRRGASANLSDGSHSASFTMPTGRDYLTEVDGFTVTPLGAASLTVTGGRWKAVKTVGKVMADKSGTPYVKHTAAQTPANLAALKMSYTAKTGVAKGSFKLYYLLNGKVKSDTVAVTGLVTREGFIGNGLIKKLGTTFAVTIE